MRKQVMYRNLFSAARQSLDTGFSHFDPIFARVTVVTQTDDLHCVGAHIKSAFTSSDYVAAVEGRAREVDAKGKRSLWYLPGGPERAQATEYLRSSTPGA